MNKLKRYCIDKAQDFLDDRGGCMGDVTDGFHAGFDAALALDLPVKFHLWTQGLHTYDSKFHYVEPDRWYVHPDLVELPKHIITKQLYQYWIDNIYKPE